MGVARLIATLSDELSATESESFLSSLRGLINPLPRKGREKLENLKWPLIAFFISLRTL